MTTPNLCSACGYELGIGRFCINCGQPVPGRHPEAPPAPSAPPAPAAPNAPTQVADAPVVPPPSGEVPPAARYPLFAEAPDESTRPRPSAPPPYGGSAPVTQVTPVHAGMRPPPPGTPGTPPPPQRRRGVAWLPWLVALVVVVLVTTAGIVLLLNSGDDSDHGSDETRKEKPTNDATDAGSSDDRPTEPAQPDSSGTDAPVPAPDPDDVVDLSENVKAKVPAVAPPSRDRNNKPVRYGPANLFDSKPRTAWRMPGDGSGTTLTLELGQEAVLTEVGLINGYAKVDGPDNWYQANRRLRAVQWEFDDGTRVTQILSEQQSLQTLAIDPVTTSSVRLHLLTVSARGNGAGGRDFTAISEISLHGALG